MSIQCQTIGNATNRTPFAPFGRITALIPYASIGKALDARKDDKTLAELAQQFDIHTNQVTEWRRLFLLQMEPDSLICHSSDYFYK